MNIIGDQKFQEIISLRQASQDDKNILGNSNKNQSSEDLRNNQTILLAKLERTYCNSLDYVEMLLIKAKTDPTIKYKESEIKHILDIKRNCKIMLNQIYKFNSWDDVSLFMYDFVFPYYAHEHSFMFRGDYNIQTILQTIKEYGFTEDKNNKDTFPPSATMIYHM